MGRGNRGDREENGGGRDEDGHGRDAAGRYEDSREDGGAVREEELLRIIERLRAGEKPGPDSPREAVHRLSRERAEEEEETAGEKPHGEPAGEEPPAPLPRRAAPRRRDGKRNGLSSDDRREEKPGNGPGGRERQDPDG